MSEEKKIAVAYTVKRYEDGSVDVEDAKLEGTQEMTTEQIYKDVEDVAELIKLKRVENSAYIGIRRFYADVQAAQEKAEAEQAAPNPTLE